MSRIWTYLEMKMTVWPLVAGKRSLKRRKMKWRSLHLKNQKDSGTNPKRKNRTMTFKKGKVSRENIFFKNFNHKDVSELRPRRHKNSFQFLLKFNFLLRPNYFKCQVWANINIFLFMEFCFFSECSSNKNTTLKQDFL